eukprot:347715-Chlamydomonas_euryale.AAC.2
MRIAARGAKGDVDAGQRGLRLGLGVAGCIRGGTEDGGGCVKRGAPRGRLLIESCCAHPHATQHTESVAAAPCPESVQRGRPFPPGLRLAVAQQGRRANTLL